MKFSKSWLGEWVGPIPGNEKLFHQLTMAGLEVDGYEDLKEGLAGVVVAEIKNVTPVENSDHLKCCQVSWGNKIVQVVCGASNVRVGLKTALAKVGTNLKGNLKIKKAKLRGVESEGMLCSASELGLGDEHDGIIELSEDSVPGEELTEVLGLDDVLIDLDLTPNRGDCLSIRGIAREVAVLNDLELRQVDVVEIEETINESIAVELKNPKDCPIYVGRVIKGIKPNLQSPLWIKEKLRRCGLRSIDPVVDVTNFVMLELGQPMHAFDLGKLDDKIVVRKAREGESLTLLDDSIVELDVNTLIIADASKPVALAGVMGGLESAVGDGTVDLFLEAAFFAPILVAGTARHFGLHTDASHRFERGVDMELQLEAMHRATQLLLEIVGGEAGPIIESRVKEEPQEAPLVSLSSNRLDQLLGVEIESERIDKIFGRLGFSVQSKIEQKDNVTWLVRPPSHRFDINLEADLVEEVCRVYGYEEIPTKLPVGELSLRSTSEHRLSDYALKKYLAGLGLQEVITYSFVDPIKMKMLDPGVSLLRLKNPMSSDQSVMRSNLFPGLVQAALSNKSRQQESIRLFELGSVFELRNENLVQSEVLSGIFWGYSETESWSSETRDIDFYDVKGCVDHIINLVGFAGLTYQRTKKAILHPGQGADIFIDEDCVGYFGKLHPELCADFEINDLFVFELEADFVRSKERRVFSTFSKFPSVRRDISVLVDRSTEVIEVKKIAEEVLGDILVSSTIFDVYEGKGVSESQKSIGLGLTLQSQKATLKEQEINDLAARTVKALQDKLGATLR